MLMLNEAAFAIGGSVEGDDVRFSRVCTDTRTLVPGDLFVALRGETHDGHDFVTTAFDQIIAIFRDRLGNGLPPLPPDF